MEFGRVTAEELETIDFTLPADKPETTSVLKRSQKTRAPKIYVGCAKWGRKDWVGKIYPKGTKEGDFLTHYARHFKCIELNATFYRMPTLAQTSGWKKKADQEDFMFCPKFPQTVTHLRRLKNTKELVDQFLEGIEGFGNNLGPIFLMLHPGMGPKSAETIQQFISELPADLDVFIEYRHEEWFTNTEAFNRMSEFLANIKKGTIITDASGRRDCVHMRLTTPSAFIRFVGNGLHPTDYTRVDDWVQRIKSWMEQGIERVFFFMHQHEELHSPELSKYVIEQLNKHCGTDIPEPVFVSNNTPDTPEQPPNKKTRKKPV